MSSKTVIFLCVANAARSQMAEGLARTRAPAGWKFYSAGSNPARLSTAAVDVMREIGIDITRQRSKGLDDVPLGKADYIVTLCAEQVCPMVPGSRAQRIHWPLPDPAAVNSTRAARLEAFRRTRDEIARLLPTLWDNKAPS